MSEHGPLVQLGGGLLSINHMTLSRKELKEHVKQHGIQDRVRIPADGEVLKF